MSTQTVRHAYNDVVATHYDRDPQGVIGRALDLGIRQMEDAGLLAPGRAPLHVLDVGMGTGLFLQKLRERSGAPVVPYGIDLAANMVEFARRRLPDLTVVVGDAARLDEHFGGHEFDAVCTHFVTGFVPMKVLGPQIFRRLKPDGFWSLVGGTKAAYPALQAKGDSKLIRRLSGAGSRAMDDTVLNPADTADAAATMTALGFEVLRSEPFRPELVFEDFDRFMEFGYHGGWLTPLIEEMGLHQAGPFKKWLLNRLAFPVNDAHNIAVVLGRKPGAA